MTLLLLGLVVLGLPLFAVALERRLPTPRLRPVRLGPQYEVIRRYRLRGDEFVAVQQAVMQGRRAEPERLRPAAAAYAELLLQGAYRKRHRWFLRVVIAVWLPLAVVYLLRHPWSVVYLVWPPLSMFLNARARRRIREARSANEAAAATHAA